MIDRVRSVVISNEAPEDKTVVWIKIDENDSIFFLYVYINGEWINRDTHSALLLKEITALYSYINGKVDEFSEFIDETRDDLKDAEAATEAANAAAEEAKEATENLRKSLNIYNLDTMNPLDEGYYNLKAGALVVPDELRKTGLEIVFKKDSDSVVKHVYVGDSFDDISWTDESNWIEIITTDNIGEFAKIPEDFYNSVTGDIASIKEALKDTVTSAVLKESLDALEDGVPGIVVSKVNFRVVTQEEPLSENKEIPLIISNPVLDEHKAATVVRTAATYNPSTNAITATSFIGTATMALNDSTGTSISASFESLSERLKTVEDKVGSGKVLKEGLKLWGRDFDGTEDIEGYIKIGDATVSYDEDKDALTVDKPIYSNGWVSSADVNPGGTITVGDGGDCLDYLTVYTTLDVNKIDI